MKLSVNISGENGVQDCNVYVEGTLLDVGKMVMTSILELYVIIQEQSGNEAADNFRKAIHKTTQETFFDLLSAEYKKDIAEYTAAPGYIHVGTQK